MSRSSVLVAFVALASLAGCAPENAPAIEARTERLDRREWFMGDWCTTSTDCRPASVTDYADEVIDGCFDYECRVFEYVPLSGEVGNTFGRCFVRKSPTAGVVCRFTEGADVQALMAGAKVGTGPSDVIGDYVKPGAGMPCVVDPDDLSATPCGDSLFCVDGVCCESDCGGGSGGDCVACSVAAGGARDGLCTPVITLKDCSTGDACVQNQRCLPSTVAIGDFAGSIFAGDCSAGESTVGLEIAGQVCCLEETDCPDDVDGDKCTVPVCVGNRCAEEIEYRGCCVTDAQCDDGNARTCDRCVETGRLGKKICESVESAWCHADAGVVVDASIVLPDLGEGPRDASPIADADVDRDGEVARDGAARMDAEVELDADVEDAEVVIDANSVKDADVVDAAPTRVTPVFRGGGGIRCAVSQAPGSGHDGAGLAGTLGVSLLAWVVSRRRR